MAERSLLVRLRDGESGALEEVTETVGPRLLNYIYRLVGDRWAAEDLAQEVFVKLLRQAPKLKESDNLPAWMFTVARNLSLNHIRGRNVAARNVPPAPEPARGPEEQASKKEMSEAVMRAVDQLEEPIRSTFLLCAIQGEDYATAAEVLGCPKKTVNTRMFRAWEKIRATVKT